MTNFQYINCFSLALQRSYRWTMRRPRPWGIEGSLYYIILLSNQIMVSEFTKFVKFMNHLWIIVFAMNTDEILFAYERGGETLLKNLVNRWFGPFWKIFIWYGDVSFQTQKSFKIKELEVSKFSPGLIRVCWWYQDVVLTHASSVDWSNLWISDLLPVKSLPNF